ncbi:ATP-binding protein [Pedobacter arcticus]|uniref:ATP-binding protein n=1 Tax=Pedobacter arcticus TaxID=752140 RepID=UPI0002E914E1|nr:ATP-binding protein [Pedobacter arcticus]
MNLTEDFKQKVLVALKEQRKKHGGNDKSFAVSYGMNPSIWSRLKGGEAPGQLIKEPHWIDMGMRLGVNNNVKAWNFAKTEVYDSIKSDVLFCKENSKAMIFVDDCEIGKSASAKHLSKTIENCFLIDASQCPTEHLFVRELASKLGVDNNGRINDVKQRIKYYLANVLIKPIVIIDEAGDLDYKSFKFLKALWNATEWVCGWYLIGADGLEEIITKGIERKKVGYREILSRFGGNYMSITPVDPQEKQMFYRKLITDVLEHNVEDKKLIPKIVKSCLASGLGLAGLRRADILLLLEKVA